MIKRRIEETLFRHFRLFVYAIIGLTALGLVISILAEFKIRESSVTAYDFLIGSALQIISWIAVGYGLFYLLIILYSWIKHSIIFGNGLKYDRKKMRAANIETKAGGAATHGIIYLGFIAAACIIVIYLYMISELFCVVGLVVAVVVWATLRVTWPPSILFLSSSKSPFVIFNHHDFQAFIRPLRAVSLLEYGPLLLSENKLIGKVYRGLELDLYRTEFDDDWKDTLERLLELTQIVIVDGSSVTPSLEYETARIRDKQLLFKCIFLKNEYGDCPLLEKIFGGSEFEGGFCVLSFKESIELIHSVLYGLSIPTESKTLAEIRKHKEGLSVEHFKSLTAEEANVYAINCLSSGRLKEAERYFLRALNSTVEMNESIWTNLSLVSINMKDSETAIRRVERALDIRPDHPNALYTKGLALELGGDRIGALACYRAFIENPRTKNEHQLRVAEVKIRELQS